MKAAVARKYAVVAFSSMDRGGSRCWSLGTAGAGPTDADKVSNEKWNCNTEKQYGAHVPCDGIPCRPRVLGDYLEAECDSQLLGKI